ncbi:MAG TPA: XrtA system polysaccharide chain length determinant [Verrucomicrobiae bacterium]|jgi:protein tyrosine kinase modulator|nr:XrtA system polysaccharide chain length determinant [Verrucomicrobiae bacterium]
MTTDARDLMEDEEPSPQKGAAVERLRAAWGRRKWLAILVFAVPCVAAVTAIFSLPTFYRSTVLVMVERQQVPETFVPSTVTSEIETRLHTISQEILSRSRLEGLIARFNLYPSERKQASNEELVERMRKDIKLELMTTNTTGRPSATTAFALSYRGPNPQTVALVTNTLGSFYIEENLKLRERQAAGTADFLKVQLAEQRKRLDELEMRVSEFKKRNLGELPQQLQANLSTLENLNIQLRLTSDNQIRAAERRDSLTALLAEAASSPQTFGASPGTGTATEPRTLRLTRLRQELASARTLYTEQHPTVVRLKSEIADAEREPAEPSGSGTDAATAASSPFVMRLREALSSVESEARILKAEEQRLRAAIAVYQSRVENTPKREQEFQEVSRDYETTKQLYESLTKRYEAAQLSGNMEQRQKGEQFRILDSAVPSDIPAAPNRFRLLVMSLVLSLGLAAGALMLAETLDTSFHSADELREFTLVPVLASVPRIVTELDRHREQRRFRLAAAGAMLGLVLIAGISYFVGHGNELLVQMLARGGS